MDLLKRLRAGVKTASAMEMERLGDLVARELLPHGGTLGLRGDLGAGKTTLVRGVAHHLGFTDITSPSFNYYFLYKGQVPLLHLDAYRLNSPADYPSLMIDELLTPQTLFVIEWPEKLGAYLPKDVIMLELSILNETCHQVRLL